jgi:RHS repeat-associated protein
VTMARIASISTSSTAPSARRPRELRTIAFVVLGLGLSTADAAEVCGNALDDDGDGYADEGCYPTLVTGVCESPLSCEDTGMVSPSTGSLRYSLPPDIAPRVPIGASIGFRRFYLSQYAPGGGAPAYRKALGERWGHTYATWIDDVSSGGVTKVILHTSRGQDVLLTKTSTSFGWDYFTPQPGVHFMSFRRRASSPFDYEIKHLTGEVLAYNGSGRLTEIRTPRTYSGMNVVTLSYDGNGQVSTVVDPSGTRRLSFSYASNVMTSVAFQINVSGTWTTYHTTSYSYASGNLASVTIGGAPAQHYTYASGYLTAIEDNEGNSLVSFVYDGATAGKIVRVDTPRGVVGYEFGSSRASCSGQTVLYFHKRNTASCDVDADCGSGFLCGGKTGSGSTGQCFRGARCLTIASPSEDVVTTITAIGPPGEICDGACLDAAGYIWNTSSGALDLAAVEDPSNHYITRSFNANGLPTRIVYGDTNSDASDGGGEREVFLFYGDANFPGKLTEVRRRSELSSNASSCSATSTVGCARTRYFYTSGGYLGEFDQDGFTFDAAGSRQASYSYTTLFSYDSDGRLTETTGPVAGIATVFEYWSSSDPLKHGFLQHVKRQKGSFGTYLTQTALTYDFRGNATSLQDPDGTISCQSFDAARGYLAERRETMNSQTDCTPHGSDLVTTWDRDSALRLTKLSRPDGSCMFYEYDARGRLATTKRRDDCNAASSGDREEYTYSADGLLTKIETFDASSTVTQRQELTYFDSRRLEKILNPVNTAKWTGFSYEDRGLLESVAAVDGSTNLSKTAWTYEAESRVSSEKRYTSGSAFDTWSLLFDWLGHQKEVVDGDSKVTKSTRDDLGRVVELDSPDLGAGPTLRVYDAANRLVTVKEALNTASERTHTFTYDTLSRPLEADYHGTCTDQSTGGQVNVPDIVRSYDALPSGVACPTGVGCANTAGRLAYVKVKLMCAGAAGDDRNWTIEQETFYSYDAAGRIVREYITDDAASPARVADQQYVWTKNGALAEVTLPSTAVLGWTYGSTNSNSDTDRVTAIWRTSTSTPIIDNILWEPYGPFKQYNQMNTTSLNPLRTRITRNLAYRITATRVEKQSDSQALHQVAISEDAKGRVTKRDYYPSDPQITGRYDSFFKYDLQDRVLCETTNNPSSCPTSGSTIKNSHIASPPFTAAGDWKQLLRPIPGSTCLDHDFALVSGTHQIASVTQGGNTPSSCTPVLGVTNFGYNALGNRSYDDNQTLNYDDRTYTYDDRRNVINVAGHYHTGSAWHDYSVASAFDARNRRVFKSFHDETSGQIATWYFYYDPLDRLTEVRHTPDISSPSTYSIFQLVWLGDRLVLYWQTDYPSVTTSKRYVATDEANRPIDMQCWGQGNCPRVWTTNPDAWGNDTVLLGTTAFQPILFAGQYKDDETIAWQDGGTIRQRPGVVENRFRSYDPWTGSYLQVDPWIASTWSSYVYADSNPVGKVDPLGKGIVAVDRTLWYCDNKSTAIDLGGILIVEAGGCTIIGGEWEWHEPPRPPGGGDGGGGGGWGAGTWALPMFALPYLFEAWEAIDAVQSLHDIAATSDNAFDNCKKNCDTIFDADTDLCNERFPYGYDSPSPDWWACYDAFEEEWKNCTNRCYSLHGAITL